MNVQELTQQFLKRYAAEQLRPSTYRGYRTNLELHVLPLLGMIPIEDLSPDDLDELTDTLRGEKGLSNKSIVYVHATLRKALNYAGKVGYIKENVYDRYDLPRVEGITYPILDDDTFSKMISNADGRTPVSLSVRLALRYGLRRGEILGIRPHTDLDAKNRILHVQRTRTVEGGADSVTMCKTRYSDRFILLLPEDAAALRSVRAGYAVPLSPTQLNKGFQKFLQLGGFPRMRFHDLRHNYATYMLRHGVDVKTISTVLGHSSVKVTLDIYTHPDVQIQRSCLEVLP